MDIFEKSDEHRREFEFYFDFDDVEGIDLDDEDASEIEGARRQTDLFLARKTSGKIQSKRDYAAFVPRSDFA